MAACVALCLIPQPASAGFFMENNNEGMAIVCKRLWCGGILHVNDVLGV